MARLPRLVVPGELHLVIHRAHSGAFLFRDAADTAPFVRSLDEASRTFKVGIHAFALLERELRLLATPLAADSLARFMQSTGRDYTRSFNARHGLTGTPWEGRFRSTVIDRESAGLDGMRFVESIESGPVLVSSSAHFTGELHFPFLEAPDFFWHLGNTPFEREDVYRKLAATGLPRQRHDEIAEAALKGWPLGSPAFLNRLKESSARPLERGRPGRPRRLAISGPN